MRGGKPQKNLYLLEKMFQSAYEQASKFRFPLGIEVIRCQGRPQHEGNGQISKFCLEVPKLIQFLGNLSLFPLIISLRIHLPNVHDFVAIATV